MVENLQVGLKWSVVHSSRQRRTAVVPCGLGSTGLVVYVLEDALVRGATVQMVMDEEDSLGGG